MAKSDADGAAAGARELDKALKDQGKLIASYEAAMHDMDARLAAAILARDEAQRNEKTFEVMLPPLHNKIAELKDELTRLRAQLAAQWQPIETATEAMETGLQVVGWDDERGSNPMIYCEDGRWHITYDDAEITPTHWMPFPVPPEKEQR